MTKTTDKLKEKSREIVYVGQAPVKRSDIFRFVGLIAFLIVLVIIGVVSWPYVAVLTEPNGVHKLVEEMQHAGVGGVFILEALQLLQIIVVLIPGEVVQIAAGMMYGPWLGALLIAIGCVLSTAFIYAVVHKLGAPFVRDMVPMDYLAKFQKFERSGKLSIAVFILFLIPGAPKDIMTYLVPLTDMPMKTFIVLTTVGRLPGVIGSTYAASALVKGDFGITIAIFVIAGILAVLGVIYREKLMDLLARTAVTDSAK